MLLDGDGRLEGIFTDSDLARLLEQRRDNELDKPIAELMTKSFSAIQSGARLSDAIDVMVQRKISELPVVDENDKPVGMIDITDVLGLEHAAANQSRKQPSLIPSEMLDDAEPIEWGDAPSTLRLFGPDQFRENS
jgi:arabinose-5-phosphate isomerase